MAIDVETIRRITVELRTVGVDQGSKSLREFAEAQEKVGKASLSAERSYEGLQRKLDPIHRAQKELEKDIQTLTRAQAQGLIPSQARLNELMALATQRYQQATGALSPFNQVMAQAQAQATGLAGRIGGVGTVLTSLGPAGLAAGAALGAAALGGAKLVQMVNDLADRGGKMVDFAETTGLTTRQIQALNKAGAEVGLTSDKIGQGFERFTVQLEQLKDGSGDLFEQLRKISPQLLLQASAAKTTADAWDVLTKAYEKADLTQRNALSRAAFGRAGIGMGRLLSASNEAGGIGGLESGLSQYAPSQEDLRRWDELKDKIDYTARTAKDLFAGMFADETLRAQLRFYEVMLGIVEQAKKLRDQQQNLAGFNQWTMGRTPAPTSGGGGGWGGGPERSFTPTASSLGGNATPAAGTVAALEKSARLHEAALASIRAQTREQRLLAVEMEKAAELSTSKLTKEEQGLEVARAREQAEAKLNQQFEQQARSLNQQAQLLESRGRNDEAAVRTMQAYTDAINQGASAMQAMAIAAATMRLSVAQAREDMANFDVAEASAQQSRMSSGASSGPNKFTTGTFTREFTDALLDKLYGPGNAKWVGLQQFGVLAYQHTAAAFLNVNRPAVEAYRTEQENIKLGQEIARQIIAGINPAQIEQQILQGKIGRGMYDEFFGPDRMASASADAIFKAILDLEKRAGADPASTLARIRSGEIGKGASTEELLRAIDELTSAVKSNTAAQVGLSPYYTQRGDQLFGYRGFDSGLPGFASGGVVYQPQSINVAERGAEAIIPLSGGAVPVRFMGANDNKRPTIINQYLTQEFYGPVDQDEVGESTYQAMQRFQRMLAA